MRYAYALGLAMLAGCGSCSCGGGSSNVDAPLACSDVAEHAGEATYYDADGSGNCSFEATPDDLLVAAMNQTDWDGSAVCGQCVRVDGPNGSVTVRITDRCPGCSDGDLDLSREAFQQIAAISAGRVAITWRPVPCEVSGPIRYRFKDGSNPFWVGIQIRNHRHAVKTVEARLADGTWKSIGRLGYNYFVDAAGLGQGPYTLRVTDIHGLTVEDQGVPLGDATEVAGAAQLPVCQSLSAAAAATEGRKAAAVDPEGAEAERLMKEMTRGAVDGAIMMKFAPATLAGVTRSHRHELVFGVAAAYELDDGTFANLDIKNSFRRGGIDLEDRLMRACKRTEQVGGHTACVIVKPDRASFHWDLPDRLTVDLSAPDEELLRAMAKELPLAEIAELSKAPSAP